MCVQSHFQITKLVHRLSNGAVLVTTSTRMRYPLVISPTASNSGALDALSKGASPRAVPELAGPVYEVPDGADLVEFEVARWPWCAKGRCLSGLPGAVLDVGVRLAPGLQGWGWCPAGTGTGDDRRYRTCALFSGKVEVSHAQAAIFVLVQTE